jgi:hypothetical protein
MGRMQPLHGWRILCVVVILFLVPCDQQLDASSLHQDPETPAVDARIEIVWPHDRSGRQQPVNRAPLVNVTAYLFRSGGLEPVADGFDAPVRLWGATNNGRAESVATGIKRMASVAGHLIPVWDFNDVDVSAAQDPQAKVFFYLTVDGVASRANVWSHGANGLTYLPQQTLPGVRAGIPDEVDASIQIVWPHDRAGQLQPVMAADLANVAVHLYHAGTTLSVSPDFDAPVHLLRYANNEPGEIVAEAAKRVTDGGYPLWEFNDVDVAVARDPRNKIYFRIVVDGVPTNSAIWSHGADARTYFPQPDVPSGAPNPAVDSGPSRAGSDTSHVGFFNVRNGVLVDQRGRDFRGVGANLPGALEYERAIDFEWLAERNVRWVRVFATNFDGPDMSHEDAARRLNSLVREAAASDIAVLVAFTNYYTRGAPGDDRAFVQDNPNWCGQLHTLAAGWFDPSTLRFDSPATPCGTPSRADVPTFRVNYLPRALTVARALRHEPNVIGYQLGNEIRPYHRPDMYLAFVEYMVDQLRGFDPNHLITPGALNIAHVLDYGDPAARSAFAAQLDDIAWDFWSATLKDWEQFTFDDLAWAAHQRIPVLLTELNFCLTSDGRRQWQEAGRSRADVVRSGSFGHLSVAELLDLTPGLAGAAPWGSAPLVNADMVGGSDACGVTNAPDAAQMWAAWTDVGRRLGQAQP